MNILLTGADGNLGTEIRRQAKTPVTQLGRDGWEDLDTALDGADTIVHAASDLRTRAAVSPVGLMGSNVMATALLLEAAKRHSIRRFVFMSSCAVYGEDMRTSEDGPCCPISINGVSKLLNEKLIAEFCEANCMEYQILRVFNTYGGHDRFSILSKLERALLEGTEFTLNNEGRMLRDFIHVSDVAAIVLNLLAAPARYSHLNIGTGEATKISTLIGLVLTQFPQLAIHHGVTQEAEYSRANIARLREFWTGEFICIEDYVRERFNPERWGDLSRSPALQTPPR
ncbi:MAG: SDR family oxidoreductase [Polaromonas sp.]